MRWLLIALLAVSIAAIADVYVAIPADTSKALYFPNVDTVLCYSISGNNELETVETDRCWPMFLQTISVKGSLLMMDRPIEQLLKNCAPLNCELRAMPD